MEVGEAEVTAMREAGIKFWTNGRDCWAEDAPVVIAKVFGYDRTWQDLHEATWEMVELAC